MNDKQGRALQGLAVPRWGWGGVLGKRCEKDQMASFIILACISEGKIEMT